MSATDLLCGLLVASTVTCAVAFILGARRHQMKLAADERQAKARHQRAMTYGVQLRELERQPNQTSADFEMWAYEMKESSR